MQTIVTIAPGFFTEREKQIVSAGPLSASVFRFESGVCGARLRNELGHLVLLPFQGQQIWSAEFYGRPLTMKSMFDEPRPVEHYLATYGGFLVHCGATAIGVPSKADTHPLHGELPNAPYQRAWLASGEDEQGVYLALGGQYRHTVAFSYNYVASPLVKLHAGSSLITLTMAVTNLKRAPMELMYLAHINFRPVDHGRLVYSALRTPDHVRVRTSVPAHIQPPAGYRQFLEMLRLRPEQHERLSPDLAFDPEVVFSVDYLADQAGWAHSLKLHPDGGADYVRHRPAQLPRVLRWICRTPDQDALGLAMPATAEAEGYLAEKAKGNVRVLPAQSEWRCEIQFGALAPPEAAEIEERIRRIVADR